MTDSRIPPAATISDGAANAIIFGTLAAVLVLTAGFALAPQLGTKVAYDRDSYMAARNSQGVVSLTLSYFVSGVGAWVIFATPQAAIIGGWLALAGYTLSTAIPLFLFGLIAPKVREKVPKGFTLNEYVAARYGNEVAGGHAITAYFALVSLFYMMLYLTAELASASTLATALTKITVQDDTWWKNEHVFTPAAISPILGVSIITLLYTAIGGLPVSILTDRVQGVGIFVLMFVIFLAAYAQASGGNKERFDDAVSPGVHPVYIPTDYGNSFAIAISLVVGVTCANMMHAGYWQRIWAAETNEAVQRATLYSAFATMLVMMLTGVCGFIAYAQYGSNMMIPGVFDISFLSIPWLVVDFMGEGWSVLCLIFGIAMIASTADTLQSAMTALLWPIANALLPTASDTAKLGLLVGVMALLNVPCVLLALSGQSILQLFLLADLLAATVVVPLFLGFHSKTHPYAALLGAVLGLAAILVVYAVGGSMGEGFDTLVKQGGIFQRGATVAFLAAPAVSGVVTVGVSKLAFPSYEFSGFAKAEAGTATTETATGGDVTLQVAAA